MSLLLGRPRPTFVVKKTGQSDVVISLEPKEFTKWTPTFKRTVLKHQLQNYSYAVKEIGYQLVSGELYFEQVAGDVLASLSRIFHKNTWGTEPGYDEVWLYPYSIDSPNFYFPVELDDQELELADFKELRHENVSLRFLGMALVSEMPFVLPDYRIIKRNVWTINEGGKPIFFPVPFSTSYYLDARNVDGVHVDVQELAAEYFKPVATVNGSVTRYIAMATTVGALTSNKIQCFAANVGSTPTAINFPAVFSETPLVPRVRALDGTHININPVWTSSGFTADSGGQGTKQCMVLAMIPGVHNFGPSKIRAFTVAASENWSQITFASALPAADYFFDVVDRASGQNLEFQNIAATGLQVRGIEAGNFTADGFAVYQQN